MTTSPPRAPTGLAARGRRFWRETVKSFELEADELQLLAEACKTMDTLDTLAAQVATDGTMISGSQGQAVLHPAVTEARQQRLVLHRLLAALALPDEDGSAVATARSLAGRMAAHARWDGQQTEAAMQRLKAVK